MLENVGENNRIEPAIGKRKAAVQVALKVYMFALVQRAGPIYTDTVSDIFSVCPIQWNFATAQIDEIPATVLPEITIMIAGNDVGI
jgi:hypothetical protein